MNLKYIDSLTRSITIFNYAVIFSFLFVMFINYQALQVEYIEDFFLKIADERYVSDFTVYNVFAATLFYGMLVKIYLPVVIIVMIINIVGRVGMRREFQTSFMSLVASVVFYVLASILIIQLLGIIETFI